MVHLLGKGSHLKSMNSLKGMGLEKDANLNYFPKGKINGYEALLSAAYDHSLTIGGNTLHI